MEMRPDEFVGPATALTDADINAAALSLGVTAAHIKAVRDVESAGRGFHPVSHRPIILFEPHVFSRLTGHRYDAGHGDLSYPKWGARPYPPTQALRYDQLFAALTIDAVAALSSASWGLFQIMGFNYAGAGYPTVDAFVRDMVTGEGAQLMAFARLVRHMGLADDLQRSDWAGFARGFNGPQFAKNAYDQKLKAAFARNQ